MSSSAPLQQPVAPKEGRRSFAGCFQRSGYMIVAALIWLGINAIIPAPKATSTPIPTSLISAPATGTATRSATVLPAATPLPSPTARR